MDTTTEHSAAAFSKVADWETNNSVYTMTTFLIGFMPWLCSRIAHTRRTSRNTYQNSRDVFSSILIHLYRTKTRLYFHQKIATIALGGGDVDRAASRVVDEVAATEMARAVVDLWNDPLKGDG